MKALIYSRVSTEKQEKEATADSQEREARAFAAARGYTIVSVASEQHSGAEFWERPILSAERVKIRNGEYDAVICHSIDRLSRNIAHLSIFVDECERAGVNLLFVTETFDQTPEGKLLMSVRGYVAEIERLKITERTSRGKRERLHRGKLINASTPLYGYDQDKETSARTIKSDEAKIVRRIWDLAFDGFGALSIAQKLNRDGIPSPAIGKREFKDGRTPQWSKSSILRILRDPAYAGLSAGLRWKHAKVRGVEKITERPRSEWVILADDLTPAIVTQSEFDKMQQLLTERKSGNSTRNETNPALLRGIIYCLKCGRRRVPDVTGYGYRCSSRYSGAGACGSGSTPMRSVEDWAWAEVAKLIGSPAEIEDRIRAGVERQLRNTDELTESLKQTETAITKTTAKMRTLIARFSDADESLAQIVDSQIEQLGQELKRLQEQQRIARAQLAAAESGKFRAGWLNDLCREFAEVTEWDFAIKRRFLLAWRVIVRTDAALKWQIEIDLDWTGDEGDETGHSNSTISMLWARNRDKN